MYVDLVLYLLSALLETFPERVMDAKNNSIYAGLLHWRRCVLRVFGCIFETASLTKFVLIA